MALQALYASGTGRGDRSAHHGQLHHLYDVNPTEQRIQVPFRRSFPQLIHKNERQSLLRDFGARAALPQNCSLLRIRRRIENGNGTNVVHRSTL